MGALAKIKRAARRAPGEALRAEGRARGREATGQKGRGREAGSTVRESFVFAPNPHDVMLRACAVVLLVVAMMGQQSQAIQLPVGPLDLPKDLETKGDDGPWGQTASPGAGWRPQAST